jgi:hypothetical protein
MARAGFRYESIGRHSVHRERVPEPV